MVHAFRRLAHEDFWGLVNAFQVQKDLRGAMAKRLAGIKTSKENIVNAIAEGRGRDSLMMRLDKLEQDERKVVAAVEREIERSNVQRHTAAMVQASWGSIVDILPDLSEEQKAEVLGALVEDVEVKEKDRIALRLFSIVELSGRRLAINSQMGAGAGLEPATFGL